MSWKRISGYRKPKGQKKKSEVIRKKNITKDSLTPQAVKKAWAEVFPNHYYYEGWLADGVSTQEEYDRQQLELKAVEAGMKRMIAKKSFKDIQLYLRDKLELVCTFFHEDPRRKPYADYDLMTEKEAYEAGHI